MSEQSGGTAPARSRRARFDLVLRGYDREQVDRTVAGLEYVVSGLERDVAALTSELDAERGGGYRAEEAERGSRAGCHPENGAQGRSSPVGTDAVGPRAERILEAVEKEADEIRRHAEAEAARIVASARVESNQDRRHANREHGEHIAHPLELAPETRLQLARAEVAERPGSRRLVRVRTEVGAKLVLAEGSTNLRDGAGGDLSDSVVAAGSARPEGPADVTPGGLPIRRPRGRIAALGSATSGSPQPDATLSGGDPGGKGSMPEPHGRAAHGTGDSDVTSDNHAV